jgi:hypothetical protein
MRLAHRSKLIPVEIEQQRVNGIGASHLELKFVSL